MNTNNNEELKYGEYIGAVVIFLLHVIPVVLINYLN